MHFSNGQTKYPLMEEWIRNKWYIYTMEYYLTVKKNEIMPLAATWMDVVIVILSEESQKEKDKCPSCVAPKKLYTGTYLQNRNRL